MPPAEDGEQSAEYGDGGDGEIPIECGGQLAEDGAIAAGEDG